MADPCLRVAIVGLGPRGTYALERLRSHAARAGIAVAVDAFETARTPGAGPHYEPSQPDCLRMNLPAGSVDMWPPDARAQGRTDFVSWTAARGRPVCADDYPPRGRVGEYLADGLARILADPGPLTVRVLPRRVAGITRCAGTWRVDARPGVEYDAVLLTTGHPVARPPARLERAAAQRLVAPPYPVERRLTPERIPAGAVVAVRGFALTFIDCALALSEGRGGTFGAIGAGPFLRYRPGGGEPAVIIPLSRSGACMRAKPAAALVAGRADLDAIAREGRARIAALPAGASVEGDLAPALAETAVRCLSAMGARSVEGSRCEAILGDMLGGVPAGRDDPRRELAVSIAVAYGRRRVDAGWALGHTWQVLYPALVARLGGDGLRRVGWPAFHRLAAQMERVAFGPGAGNAARLLALIDGGLVRLDHVAGGDVVAGADGWPEVRSPAGALRVDRVVDAVLAPPGVVPGDPLVEGLIGAGHARIAAGRRGLDVDAAGRCRGRTGAVTPGLAAIGRVTEDVVVGNDTLSRTLHPTPDLWARALVEDHARRTRHGAEALAVP